MLWVKRIACGIIALCLLCGGIKLLSFSSYAVQIIGFCLIVVGIALSYIAVIQRMPKYNFWITLVALGLGFALFLPRDFITNNKTEDIPEKKVEKFEKKSAKKVKKQKKQPNFKFSGYPRISGQIEVINANLFYINGRYVRLYGVDAPDNDQICSDSKESSYNCGVEAASWVRGWIDDNIIDCYILKVTPNATDIGVCVWGNFDIGEALVGSGWGIANTNETNMYVAQEEKARKSLSGLWQGSFYTPEDWRKIKKDTHNFKIKRRKSMGGFFNFKSLF